MTNDERIAQSPIQPGDRVRVRWATCAPLMHVRNLWLNGEEVMADVQWFTDNGEYRETSRFSVEELKKA